MNTEPPEEPPAPPTHEGPQEPERRQSGAWVALGALAGALAVVGVVTLVVAGICVALVTGTGR